MHVDESTGSAPGSDFRNEVIRTDHLPRLEDLEFEGHPRRYKRFRLMWVGIFAALLAMFWIGIGVVSYFREPEDQFKTQVFAAVIAGIWLLVFLPLVIEETRGFRIRGYALRERDVTYRSGFLFRKVTTVPFNRIQHSEISQGPVARSFKLSHLKIYTAGGSGSDLKIPGLEPEEAVRLRDFINGESGKHA